MMLTRGGYSGWLGYSKSGIGKDSKLLYTDRHVKFDAYEQAGVNEYWIVNPKTRPVEVYTLSGGEYALSGEFTGDELLDSAVLADITVVTKSLFDPIR